DQRDPELIEVGHYERDHADRCGDAVFLIVNVATEASVVFQLERQIDLTLLFELDHLLCAEKTKDQGLCSLFSDLRHFCWDELSVDSEKRWTSHFEMEIRSVVFHQRLDEILHTDRRIRCFRCVVAHAASPLRL